MNPTASNVSSLTAKYLTIVLDSEAYGIAVLKVREIIRQQKITPIPHLPEFVKGVINLRGRVIPVIDLRVKFDLQAVFTERTCVVVVHVTQNDRPAIQMGLIVDAVEEVVNLSAEDIQPTPDFGTRVDTSYLLGLARIKGQVKMLLDIDRVVAPSALEDIARAV